MSQTTTNSASETLGFQAEVKQLLHLMIHSLQQQGDLPARAGVERVGRVRQAALRGDRPAGLAGRRRGAGDPGGLRQGRPHDHDFR